ncbi:MAG TPA: hypothetical protein VEK33_15285 [Terriglobales bacterium]|nr:hypothetical protein [Terriglobales bacterium]
MRYGVAILLLAVLASTQTARRVPASLAQAIPVDQENANRAKALLDQMIQALGGDAYLSIREITQEGRTYGFHHGQAEGAGVLFWRFYKYPDRDRVELTKQRDVVYIYRGDQGFEITYKGTRADDPKTVSDYVRRRQYSLDWVLREWLHEPGIALFYEGSAVAAQKDTQQVTIMNSRNQAVTLNIDSSTHLPVKKTFSWRDPTDKERNIEDEVYDNYRPVGGIMTPFSITRFYNGDMSNQRFLHAVEYNKDLSDTLFEATITYSPKR